MRPIKLKIKGLNSFIEEQTIDFEELTKQGFFGIFGPTGSGKSTILDGMILALYGMKGMSRGTNEFVNKNCKSAQVSYEFQITESEVKRYRVEREFKASEKGTKSGKCRLLDVTNGEVVLEDSVTGVERACADMIGLTADDFMRTVVLPQGKFSEFLKVSGKDRREILERLFRLEDYGVRLEERIASAIKKEQTERTRFQGQAEIYGDCTKEKLNTARTHMENCQKETKVLETLWRKSLEQAEQYKEIWKWQEEQRQWKQTERELLEKESEIKEKENRILLSEKAERVMPILSSVTELEAKEEKLTRQLAETVERYEAQKTVTEIAQDTFQKLEVQKAENETKLLSELERAKEAVQDSEVLPELRREQQEREKLLSESRKQEEHSKEQWQILRRQKEEQVKRLEELEEVWTQSVITNEYREVMESFVLRYNELTGILREKKEKEEQTRKKKMQAEQLRHEIEVLKKNISELEKELNCWKAKEQEQDETVEQMQILHLQKKLKEGEPCPVCGSIHFLKEGNQQSETKELASGVLEKLEKLKKQIEQMEEGLQKIRQEYGVKQNLLYTVQEEQQELEKKTEAITEELEEKKNALQEELSAYGIQSLKAERERIKTMDSRRESLEKERSQEQQYRAKLEKQLEESESIWKQWEQKALEIERTLLPLREKMLQKQEQIKSKIGGRTNPKEYFRLLQNELVQFRTQYQETKEKKEKAEILLKQCEEAWQICNGTKRGNDEALQNAERHLERELKRQDFADREDVRQALLSGKQKESYQTEMESYGRRMQQTKTQLETIKNRLDGRSVERKPYEEALRRCETLEAEKREKEELRITLRQEISRMEEHLKQQEHIQKELSEIEHRLAILEDLRSVTRGKRFVEFLATERLRYISKSASKRLYEITNGNYELEINAEGEFIIRDNKNGGVLRQTATLSGGETFVTSLALALALSAEIQLKGTAPLELFFLDEGFGSLDDILLDVVMESLEKIHHDRLKVGIISHVESVKARVPVRLMVTPAETGVGGSRVKIEYS